MARLWLTAPRDEDERLGLGLGNTVAGGAFPRAEDHVWDGEVAFL